MYSHKHCSDLFSHEILSLPTLAFNGVYVLDKKCNNVFIRNALYLQLQDAPLKHSLNEGSVILWFE